MAYWTGEGTRAYHHTAPINALYGLHEALRRLLVEGLENSFARHKKAHDYLVARLEKRGMDMLVDPSCRLPQLNTIKIPAGADDAKIRRSLLLDHNIEIGAGLGPLAGKVWRVGLMGEGARTECVDALFNALDTVMAA